MLLMTFTHRCSSFGTRSLSQAVACRFRQHTLHVQVGYQAQGRRLQDRCVHGIYTPSQSPAAKPDLSSADLHSGSPVRPHAEPDARAGRAYGDRPPLVIASFIYPELEAFMNTWRRELVCGSERPHNFLFSR